MAIYRRWTLYHALTSIVACYWMASLVTSGPYRPYDGLAPVDVSQVLSEGEVLDVWILAGKLLDPGPSRYPGKPGWMYIPVLFFRMTPLNIRVRLSA